MHGFIKTTRSWYHLLWTSLQYLEKRRTLSDGCSTTDFASLFWSRFFHFPLSSFPNRAPQRHWLLQSWFVSDRGCFHVLLPFSLDSVWKTSLPFLPFPGFRVSDILGRAYWMIKPRKYLRVIQLCFRSGHQIHSLGLSDLISANKNISMLTSATRN